MEDVQDLKLSPIHQLFVNRFLQACQIDDRVAAACLIGSYARGRADRYSDIDLMVICTDASFDEICQQREIFLRSLGDLVFHEDFGIPDLSFYIFADGTEGELYYGSEGRLEHLYDAPFRILLDKNNILAGVTYSSAGKEFNVQEQTDKLCKYIRVFWHEMSHFTTAIGRDQLWWARGQLESLRSICVNLARLQHDFSDTEAGEEPYFKIENCMPVENLVPLQSTFCPMERTAMLQAVQVILSFYVTTARSLTEKHRIPYPHGLDNVMRTRLNNLLEAQYSNTSG